jgi:hypothetical protein
MNVLKECKNTSAIAVSGVLLAGCVYSYAAYESLSGRYPGAYTPLAMLAPIFLLANNYALFLSVVKSILPTAGSQLLFALTLVGGTMFQAACAGRSDLRIIVVLAIFNMVTYTVITLKQHKLNHDSLVSQCKSQQALSSIVNAAIKKKAADL